MSSFTDGNYRRTSEGHFEKKDDVLDIDDESDLVNRICRVLDNNNISYSQEYQVCNRLWDDRGPYCDILLIDDNVAVECKKDIQLTFIQKAIGQCLSYEYYGYDSAIIVPEPITDREIEQQLSLAEYASIPIYKYTADDTVERF